MELPSEIPLRKAGYARLIEEFNLHVLPNHVESFVAARGSSKSIIRNNRRIEIYRAQYWPGDSPFDHTVFAFKYEGINLAILSRLFERMPRDEIEAFIRDQPLSKFARKAWYLYEFLTGVKLAIPDLDRGNYVPLLDENEHITSVGLRSPRHKIIDNSLGPASFCPNVRRTPLIRQFLERDFRAEAEAVASHYPEDILRRAVSYLYTKETKSSFEIERDDAPQDRTTRFISLLKEANRRLFTDKNGLISIRNSLVDERFAERDYRSIQTYVGQSVRLGREIVHFVPPKPDDLSDLMQGWMHAFERMSSSNINAVVAAGVASFGFVFIHPFLDGNGRIHRFLIHNILAVQGMTPAGFIFPVSATLLRNRRKYDETLEIVSVPLLRILHYDLDTEGQMSVDGETAVHYRYIDYTPLLERLFEFVSETIEKELSDEFEFLLSYDRAVGEITRFLDIPDRQLDLFIRLVLQNSGRLSDSKRKSHFTFLTNDEIEEMEKVVRTYFGTSSGGSI